MKAMVLAAGKGERMLPLTRTVPKPLLEVGGRPLLDYHLERLSGAGVAEVVINVSHLGHLIEQYCGNGSRWGLRIEYSREESPLETAGGIARALPLLDAPQFLVLNADVWTDFSVKPLLARQLHAGCAHLVMVDNPPQHPQGDFVLASAGLVRKRGEGESGYTYAGIGIYTRQFFADLSEEFCALRPLLDHAIDERRLSAEHFGGDWEGVGTPDRLASLQHRVVATYGASQ